MLLLEGTALKGLDSTTIDGFNCKLIWWRERWVVIFSINLKYFSPEDGLVIRFYNGDQIKPVQILYEL